MKVKTVPWDLKDIYPTKRSINPKKDNKDILSITSGIWISTNRNRY